MVLLFAKTNYCFKQFYMFQTFPENVLFQGFLRKSEKNYIDPIPANETESLFLTKALAKVSP